MFKIYISVFDLRNTCQLNLYFGIIYYIKYNKYIIYIFIEFSLPTFGGNMSIGGFLCALWGPGLGNVHVVIYIFVLDKCGQHLGDICQLEVFCAPFGAQGKGMYIL